MDIDKNIIRKDCKIFSINRSITKGSKGAAIMTIDDLLACMKIIGKDTIQRKQLTHRLSLVEAFQISPGMKVLEIGCGQGDTTVALAAAVGEGGHVMSIDIAPADYGEPITLGEATETISRSILGNRVSFQLQTDLLDLPEQQYDVAVLSHCSWYFRDPEQLLSYFHKLRRMAKRICVAEWDLYDINQENYAHYTAVTILALYSEFVDNMGNIQHLFDRNQLQQYLQKAGWENVTIHMVDAYYLQDGVWETDYAINIRKEFRNTSTRVQALLNSFYIHLETDIIHSLNSVVLTSGKD